MTEAPKLPSIYGLYDRSGALRYGHLSEANKQKFRDLAEYDPQLFGCWKHI